ncbi:MAG: hypothetical protein J6Q48_04995 [Bacteroidaceae bacterium]|nr:hypothetical protein [Bacteroidaceae bacterium]
MPYIVKTRDNFWINGISALSVGLATEMPAPVPMANQRYTIWSSGDTDHSTPDDSFEDVEYTIVARRFKTPDNFLSTDIYSFLADAKTLRISRNAGRYYRIKRVLSVVPTAAYRGNEITYRITFALSPFAYFVDNPEITIDNSVRQIENQGTRYSRPIYKVNHSTTEVSELSVNGQVLKIAPEASNPVWIDCERMIAYNSEGENQTQYTTGIFPFLSSGTNRLQIATGYTLYEMTVIGNWRDY